VPLDLLRHPRAGVGDDDADHGPIAGDVRGLDGQRSTVRHGTPRVRHQVQQQPLQFAAVDAHRPQARRQARGELDVLPDGAAQHPLGVGDDLVGVQDLGIERLLTAEDQQLPGQRGAALRELADHGHALAVRVVVGQIREGEVGVPEDHGEQIVEVVRDAPGEPAEGVEPFGLPQLLLQGSALPAFLRLLQLAPDDRHEPAHPVLQHDVVGARAHQHRRLLLPDPPADEDERQIVATVPEQFQRLLGTEPRHVVVADHQVRGALAQRLGDLLGALGTLVVDAEPAAPQMGGDQQRVVVAVLADQQPDQPPAAAGHGAAPGCGRGSLTRSQ
jgi:hypothetical protein